MNYLLFLDTETTGFPPKGRLVQLAAILTDWNGHEILTLNSIVKPDGFEIPDEAVKIHGITTEHALEKGVDLRMILYPLKSIIELPDLQIVAFNAGFDIAILKGEFESVGWSVSIPSVYDMMLGTVDLCRLPKKGGGYKCPKLGELFKITFDTGDGFIKEMTGAHDALNDARATKDIYFELKNKGRI